MTLTAVLFDLDDTLLDRRATLDGYLAGLIVRASLGGERAASFRDRFFSLDGAGYVPRATVFGQLCAEFPESGAAAEHVIHWLEHAWDDCRYMEGATETLAWCRASGLRTAIVTNGPSAMQRSKIERLGLAPLVDTILVSGEEGMHKPDVEIFRRAAERLGVAAESCAFVGDNPLTDIAGARAAGMTPIWMSRDLAWPADAEGPRHVISELRALREILGVVLHGYG
jgi:putative hydrolase of the HAD superfamily